MTTAIGPVGRLLSELVAEAVRPHAGAVGVIVRDILFPDPITLLERLTNIRDESGFPDLRIAYLLPGGEEAESGFPDLRTAYLLPGGEEAETEIEIDEDVFTTEIEQAERWRNDRDLEALIVIIARGDEAKLSSLEDFGTVTSQNLKDALVERAMGGPAGDNEIQTLLWQVLAKDDAVGLGQLVDYYLSLQGKDGTDFKTASSRELHRVGLLPDPALFNNTHLRAMQKRLRSNREMVERLQMLTPKDRRTIKKVLEVETEPDKKAKLRQALDLLHRTRFVGATSDIIDYEHALRLVNAHTKKGGNKDKSRRPKKKPSVDFAAEALVNSNRVDDLNDLHTNLQRTLEAADTRSARTVNVRSQLSSSIETITTVRMDVVNLIVKVLDDGIYGGLIQSDLDDINDLLRRFNVHEHVVAKWERGKILEVLKDIAEASEGGTAIAEHFTVYDKARTAILPYVRALVADPLVVAANAEAREKLLAAVHAYESLTHGIRDYYDTIFEIVGSDVDELVGLLLLMDIVVIKGRERLYAVLSPVHPLFLWHYAMYADVVEAQRDRLDDRDKKLIADAACCLPNFLTSLYVPAAALGQGKSLTCAGLLSQLPYYSDSDVGNSSDESLATISGLLTDYVALEPHARPGLRVALVDPPDPGRYLREIVDLHDDGVLRGAHVVVYQHRPTRLSVELRLDADDEVRIAQVFHASSVDRRFTFEVRGHQTNELGPGDRDPFHIAVVFDQSKGRITRARPATHPIQPLAVPRRIHYSTVHKTVELEPALGGLFESYYKVVGRIAEGSGRAACLAVHQQKELRDTLGVLAQRVPWIVVADRHVDRDLNIGALRIFTSGDRQRDVAAFARSTAAFRRPLREVARQYNTFITDEELDELLRQLSRLLDSGLLSLKPTHAGKINESHVKGLLATLIAALWYRKDAQTGTRLLISLDSQDALRWMHLSNDPRRADLVGFEWTNDHCTVTVIEVKSVDATASEYRIENGVVSGPAVDQMLATRRLLAAMLVEARDDELITTPARREVLREQLYRELTKGMYSPDERKLWTDRLRRLLDGDVDVEVGCHLIEVRLGVDASTLRDRSVIAKDGEESVRVRVRELNEELIGAPLAPQPPAGEEGNGRHGTNEGAERSKTPVPSGGDEVGVGYLKKDERLSDTEDAPEPVSERSRRSAESNTTHEAAPKEARPCALLGTAPGPYGKPREIWFDPNLPAQKLPNPHISITGETGSGKTQATKAIVSELRQQGLPVLILDFKDDYSSESFIAAEDLRLYDTSFSSLPLNPLIPAIDKRQNLINPSQHTYQVSDIIKRIYKLGDQQAFRLREAIKRAYTLTGISLQPGALPAGKTFPQLDVVQHELSEDKANEPLLGRLSPIFDLGLFAAEAEQSNFEDFFHGSAVIRLGQLPSDEVKNSVAEFFLMALYNHLIRQPQTHLLDRLLVLDEAWRVVESPFLAPLMREGRAFGLGVVIATQFPRDLPEAVRGSTATRIYFSQGQVEQVREIQRTIVGKTSGPEAEHVAGVVRGLTPLSCVMYSTQYNPFVRVTIIPYFRRRMHFDANG